MSSALSKRVLLVSFCVLLLAPSISPLSNGGDVLDDSTCNIEAIETANSNQLYNIFDELLNTTQFRIFKVDLKRQCHRDKAIEPKCTDPEPVNPFGIPAGFHAEEDEPKKCDVSGGAKIDLTLSKKEEEAAQSYADNTCDPSVPEFWLDMCSQILPTGDTSEYVNLVLNPEAHTGYNGSNVWERMYSYADVHFNPEEQCYEERVLYRLLSGMHASINVHISNSYFAPSKKRGNKDYLRNAKRFMDQYGEKPEYLANLHFSYVVVLRAVQKAAPVLRRMTIDTGTYFLFHTPLHASRFTYSHNPTIPQSHNPTIPQSHNPTILKNLSFLVFTIEMCATHTPTHTTHPHTHTPPHHRWDLTKKSIFLNK